MSALSHPRATRRVLMLVAGILASLVAFTLGGEVALAHHSDIVADSTCNGGVTFTASAWNGPDVPDWQRVNADVRVWYRLNDASATPVGGDIEVTHGAFAAPTFSFSGSFAWPASDPPSITVFVQEQANWETGGEIGYPVEPRTATVTRATGCNGSSANVGSPVCAGDNSASVNVTFAATGASQTFVVTLPAGASTNDALTFSISGNDAPVVVHFTGVANTNSFGVNYTVDGAPKSTTPIVVSCTTPGTPSASASAVCASPNHADVDVTFSVAGGTRASDFVVQLPAGASTNDDLTFSLAAGDAPVVVRFTDVGNSGSFVVDYTVDGVAKATAPILIICIPGTGTVAASVVCSDFDGVVTVTLTSAGPFASIFVIDGTTYSVLAGAPQQVVFTNLPDGAFSKTITINGVDQTIQLADVGCDPAITATPICNEVDVNGAITTYWFTVANGESSALEVRWTGGTLTVPAGGSVKVASAASHLDLQFGQQTIASADSNNTICGRDVTFTKNVVGQAPAAETYTVQVSRLVGAGYVPVLTFDIVPGSPQTFTLPSSLGAAGVTYKVQETAFGTASTHTVSPDSFNLTGNVGETVSVVVTNGYAAVQIDKAVSATTVRNGGTLSYTLVAKNTGALTLNPALVSDQLPAKVSLVSALVAGDAGDCILVKTSRPQLVECLLDAPLAPGATAPTITIVVIVDNDTPANANLINQAKVLGAYTHDGKTDAQVLTDLRDQSRADYDDAIASCLPAASGAVCDLSAAVSTLVTTEVQSEPPAPTSTTVVSGGPITTAPRSSAPLPATGSTGLGNMLAAGFVLLTVGGLLVWTRRRFADPA